MGGGLGKGEGGQLPGKLCNRPKRAFLWKIALKISGLDHALEEGEGVGGDPPPAVVRQSNASPSETHAPSAACSLICVWPLRKAMSWARCDAQRQFRRARGHRGQGVP